MAWLQVILKTSESKAEILSECLMNAGAAAVTFQDAEDRPIFEPAPGTTPLWKTLFVIGLFDAENDLVSVKRFLKSNVDPDTFSTLQIDPLEDKNWSLTWMEHFHPMRFGQKLWICPSWHEPLAPNDINIMLDPGLAFGTGTHPTTHLCLEWLDSNPPQNAHIIDYGCGSGILSIAAIMLGAAHVYAIDNDPQALTSTKLNAEKNAIKDDTLTIGLPNLKINKKADLILANILANTLVELLPTFLDNLNATGKIVLSGLLENQIELIRQNYEPYFKIIEIAKYEEWALIYAIKK